jgi:hypothetical protein
VAPGPIVRIVLVARGGLAVPAALLGYAMRPITLFDSHRLFGFSPMAAMAVARRLRNKLSARAEPPKGIFAEFS